MDSSGDAIATKKQTQNHDYGPDSRPNDREGCLLVVASLPAPLGLKKLTYFSNTYKFYECKPDTLNT